VSDKKKTRKITMTVFCSAADAENVKDSLFGPKGDDWYNNNGYITANISIKDEEPTDEEEQANVPLLQLDDDDEDDDECRYPQAILDNVAAVMGYEVEGERISNALCNTDDFADDDALKARLEEVEKLFVAQGGRGIDLAEEIDDLRITLAVRETPDKDVV
jgi:hypothetical protein